MTTPTEAHLQVIVDKIEAIQNIHADVGLGEPSRKQKKSAINCLEAIGTSMRYIPDEFKEKYNGISWNAIGCWGTRGRFSPRYFHRDLLDRCERFFAEQKSEISRHAGFETEIQKGVLSNLQVQYEELSRNLHTQILLPYVLIPITGILFVIRIGLVQDTIDLNFWESVLYSLHVLIIFFIGIYTQTRHSNNDIANDTHTYHYTHTDFYNRSHRNWCLNVSTLRGAVLRHEFYRAILTILWTWTLIAAILATVIAVA